LLQFSLFSALVALFVIYSKPFPNNHPSISSSNSGQVDDEYSGQVEGGYSGQVEDEYSGQIEGEYSGQVEDEYSQQQEQNQTETKLILRFMIAWFLILSIMVSIMMIENSIDASTKVTLLL
jgi:methionine-rich copper-binding protein CopC